MNDISHTLGLMRSELRDVRSVAANIDHRTRKQFEPQTIHRAGGLMARFAAVELMARAQKRKAADVAQQLFRDDIDLAHLIEIRGAVGPALSSQAGWASELAAVVVQDVADNMMPQSALAQLRAVGLSYGFINGAVARVPTHQPTPSGAFVLEGNSIPLGALLLGSFALKPKKCAGIVAMTKELVAGSPANVETSLQALLSQDIGLLVDNVLLGSAASSAAQPAGLLNGLTPITATAGGGVGALLGDLKKLLTAISPAVRPVVIANNVQAASIATLSQSSLPLIVAPYLPADQIIAVDAAAFASALGALDISVNEDPTIHMSDTPLPIGTPGSPPVVSAPTQSLWQTASIGMRVLLDVDWVLRRTGAVAFTSGTTW